MVVVIEMDPYESGEVKAIIGPFQSFHSAEMWVKAVKKFGAHPDSEWKIVEMSDPMLRAKDIKDENRDWAKPGYDSDSD